jgi:hypothetical protein
MEHRKSALERAFELAKEGRCPNITDIRRRLQLEGYSSSQIEGPQLHKQLRALIVHASSFSPRAQ